MLLTVMFALLILTRRNKKKIKPQACRDVFQSSFCALDGSIVIIMWRIILPSNQNVLKSALLRGAASIHDINKLTMVFYFLNELHAVVVIVIW